MTTTDEHERHRPRRGGTWWVRTPRRIRPRHRSWRVRTPGSARSSTTESAGPEPAELVGSFARALDGMAQSVENDGMRSPAENSSVRSEREHGDRHQFLAEARRRLSGGAPANRVHPRPPTPPEGAGVPQPQYTTVGHDGPGDEEPSREDLIAAFAQTLEEAGGTCHVVDGDIPETLLDTLVAELDAWQVVVSAEPEAHALGERLANRGVEVTAATPEAAAGAGLGITSASAGIAATGSIVLDSSQTGGRVVSILPPVHLCVLPAERIVATPSAVLRPLGDDPTALPASLVLVTGPSRSGDIEQILTVGAHGPAQLHVIVVKGGKRRCDV